MYERRHDVRQRQRYVMLQYCLLGIDCCRAEPTMCDYENCLLIIDYYSQRYAMMHSDGRLLMVEIDCGSEVTLCVALLSPSVIDFSVLVYIKAEHWHETTLENVMDS